MDPLWDKYPQSPTHCSPENIQLSLNALVLQDYERNRSFADEEQVYSRSSGTLVFESPTSTSSVASPMPSTRRYDIDELEFVRHGHRTASNVWEEHLPDYEMIQDTYNHKKQEIFADISKILEQLQDLEHRFEKAKMQFHQRLAGEYAELSKGLAARKARLQRETRQFQDWLQASEGPPCQSEKVRLNVGGQIFETSTSTLRRDESSLLAAMVSKNLALKPEPDGSYFIDRDPSHFRYILNYLRDLKIPSTVFQEPTKCQELLQEARYYRVEDLVQRLSKGQ